jgi:hypothetical protein
MTGCRHNFRTTANQIAETIRRAILTNRMRHATSRTSHFLSRHFAKRSSNRAKFHRRDAHPRNYAIRRLAIRRRCENVRLLRRGNSRHASRHRGNALRLRASGGFHAKRLAPVRRTPPPKLKSK